MEALTPVILKFIQQMLVNMGNNNDITQEKTIDVLAKYLETSEFKKEFSSWCAKDDKNSYAAATRPGSQNGKYNILKGIRSQIIWCSKSNMI